MHGSHHPGVVQGEGPFCLSSVSQKEVDLPDPIGYYKSGLSLVKTAENQNGRPLILEVY